MSPSTRQAYGYVVKNHIVPYIGHLRISEVNRETFFNLLVKVLPRGRSYAGHDMRDLFEVGLR